MSERVNKFAVAEDSCVVIDKERPALKAEAVATVLPYGRYVVEAGSPEHAN